MGQRLEELCNQPLPVAAQKERAGVTQYVRELGLDKQSASFVSRVLGREDKKDQETSYAYFGKRIRTVEILRDDRVHRVSFPFPTEKKAVRNSKQTYVL